MRSSWSLVQAFEFSRFSRYRHFPATLDWWSLRGSTAMTGPLASRELPHFSFLFFLILEFRLGLSFRDFAIFFFSSPRH